MNILQEIVEFKKKEVAENKEIKPIKLLERSIFFDTKVVSMREYLLRDEGVGIIAEIKRKSPSKGVINDKVDVEKLSIAYMQAGASALSILTDQEFFGGSIKDLEIARKFNYCPILRKDFVIDAYQVIESKSIGADCILLIAACLSPQDCQDLAKLAHSLGLEVLLEVRDEEEIQSHVNDFIDVIGVNNRNLDTFTIDLKNSEHLYSLLPDNLVKISESGITTGGQMKELKDIGFDGFLIGGYFMKHDEPGRVCKKLIDEYKSLI